MASGQKNDHTFSQVKRNTKTAPQILILAWDFSNQIACGLGLFGEFSLSPTFFAAVYIFLPVRNRFASPARVPGFAAAP